jgi:hypothetical protein
MNASHWSGMHITPSAAFLRPDQATAAVNTQQENLPFAGDWTEEQLPAVVRIDPTVTKIICSIHSLLCLQW